LSRKKKQFSEGEAVNQSEDVVQLKKVTREISKKTKKGSKSTGRKSTAGQKAETVQRGDGEVSAQD